MPSSDRSLEGSLRRCSASSPLVAVLVAVPVVVLVWEVLVPVLLVVVVVVALLVLEQLAAVAADWQRRGW